MKFEAHRKLQWLAILVCAFVILGYIYGLGTSTIESLTMLQQNQVTQLIPRELKDLLDLWSRTLDEMFNDNSNSSMRHSAPFPPHFQDCERCSELHSLMDNRKENGGLPLWSTLGGPNPSASNCSSYIPWIRGADEENLPLTRPVQRHLWLHQHPENCSNEKFLMATWLSETAELGIGSQMVFLAALLSEAVSEGRVLITLPYHGARHDGCTGPNYSRWSCYFAPEASQECIDRALELYHDNDAWIKGKLKHSQDMTASWSGAPSIWGEPWKTMPPTEDLNGVLIDNYHNDRRWWRAQAYRYLLRFPSKYLCNLLNQARHQAFGKDLAELIVLNRQSITTASQSPLEESLWSNFRPWIPRPMVSMHVRQGDKQEEMKIHSLEDYVALADRLRRRFPDLANIWLSTEMQNVVEESKNFKEWNFYFTDMKRQRGTMRMADYMRSLGTRTAYDNSYVNLMMALEADFFVGALGSSWSYAIDCLRLTGGKLNAGFLTVNPINL